MGIEIDGNRYLKNNGYEKYLKNRDKQYFIKSKNYKIYNELREFNRAGITYRGDVSLHQHDENQNSVWVRAYANEGRIWKH